LTKTVRQGKRSDALRLSDMERAAALVDEILSLGRERFVQDPVVQDAVIRRLEILGEAAGHISDQTRRAFPSIEWSKMRGFSSFAKHEYWRVDVEKLWAAIEEIPKLRRELSRVRLDSQHSE